MQKRPSQVKICTQARRRMVCGMAIMSWRISAAAAPMPAFSAFSFSKASTSSGGYSFVVKMVQSTAARKANAPK
jgi:hypothetical protein